MSSDRAVNQPSFRWDRANRNRTQKGTQTLQYSRSCPLSNLLCYHHFDYLSDPESCSIFMEELDHARSELQFHLWAYVLMPNHVHLLIYPYRQVCKISIILQAVKGRTSKRYSLWLRETYPRRYEHYLVRIGLNRKFRFWQASGGFDRNLWNPEAIHRAINYIERNPAPANLAAAPEPGTWSSARCFLSARLLCQNHLS